MKRTVVRRNVIPDEILNNASLNEAIARLPSNYNFEIHKTIHRITQAHAKTVCLQFPEGLAVYACAIADIIRHFAHARVIVMGDVTYGACCVDDYSAKRLGADFMVHYGHSCLIPIQRTQIPILYVFVELHINVDHLVSTIHANVPEDNRIALLGTIQFSQAIHQAAAKLQPFYPEVLIPQEKPLSRGEVLGCTSPLMPTTDCMIFLADGRFHIESAMITNPSVRALRYNPYTMELTEEEYDLTKMRGLRGDAIAQAKKATHWGLILGTLGRQGNEAILERLKGLLRGKGMEYDVVLLSEISDAVLSRFESIDCWVQIACPRLSIDWGAGYSKPLITCYEAFVALGEAKWTEKYPMDWYSAAGGPWSNGQ
ncbi:hypothetical protein WA588_006437, partial [Blastocystis sp. NMH]